MHFGPGILIKAIVPHRFWLTSFLTANVLIDLEVLYYLHQGQTPIHRYLHTYVGGFSAGILAGLGMFTAVMIALKIVPAESRWLKRRRSIPGPQLCGESLAAGLLGGVSHVLLDSFMHHDMHPWWPFADGNTSAGTLDIGGLHIALALAGFFGIVVWLFMREP